MNDTLATTIRRARNRGPAYFLGRSAETWNDALRRRAHRHSDASRD